VIITQTGNEVEGVSRSSQRDEMVETLKYAAELCGRADVTLTVEPLNGLVDHSGHFLQHIDESVNVIDRVDSPHVKLLFDVYHQQITEGNVTRNLIRYLDRIHHVHIADNPGRLQPGTGELNYGYIIGKLKDAGYGGVIGLECGYSMPTDEALAELRPLLDM
jgi:hydroxypyruvate isomerase